MTIAPEAIEAAALELYEYFHVESDVGDVPWSLLTEMQRGRYLDAARDSIIAYEKAAWRPIEEAPTGLYVAVYPPSRPRRGLSVASYEADKFSKYPKPHWLREDRPVRKFCLEKPPTHFRPLPIGPEGDV